jgi:hypothetical protein
MASRSSSDPAPQRDGTRASSEDEDDDSDGVLRSDNAGSSGNNNNSDASWQEDAAAAMEGELSMAALQLLTDALAGAAVPGDDGGVNDDSEEGIRIVLRGAEEAPALPALREFAVTPQVRSRARPPARGCA